MTNIFEKDIYPEVDSEAAAAAVPNAKKPSRIEHFSQRQVSEAIQDLNQKFYENTNCIRCNYFGTNARALAQHISRMHKDLKPHWCCTCNGEYDNLSDHLATNHSDDYICKLCSKKFEKKKHLYDHLLCHSDEKFFRCSFCEKSFIRPSCLNLHLLSHLHMNENKGDADKQPFVAMQNFCVKCNKKVPSLLMHTMCDDKHLCTVCGKRFKAAFRLKTHMRVHSSEALRKCKHCDKKFKTHNVLAIHERTHTGERPHVCQVCGTSFAQKGALTTHMLIHNIGLKRSCKICNKKFSRPFQLRVHLRRHTGETPFVCTECGKGFILRSHLLIHNKTHSDLRPYKCSYCDKTLRTNRTLKSHMWIHLGEKPYKCNQCSYACRFGNSLTKHMMKHAVDKPKAVRKHVCLMCSRTFTTDAMLTSHINRHTVSFLEIGT